MNPTRIVIVGGGFAGLNAAKRLAKDRQVRITLIDRRNHHLFQPLLYQVAMAGLSPAEIAAPVRSIVSRQKNIRDKGQMATIGRSRAITEVGKYCFAGFFAWLVWLIVHIYFLTGFRNRLFVVISWAWSFFAFRRGARLIVGKRWRSFDRKGETKRH